MSTIDRYLDALTRVETVFAELRTKGMWAEANGDLPELDTDDTRATVRATLGGEPTAYTYYERFDEENALATGELWLHHGSFEGEAEDERVGRLIVDTFRVHGFEVLWGGKAWDCIVVSL